ncbi:MAG: glycosyltransferase [Acholeplasma sp.]|nr:glycosyltransferase [Acholeplasma sp.]
MYTRNDICAVIVTYNPENDVFNNVKRTAEQVDKVFVIDNSEAMDWGVENLLKDNKNVIVYQYFKNMGIAEALNKGLTLANEHGYKLLITLDQDSEIELEYVAKVLHIFNQYSLQPLSIGPNYANLKIEGDMKKQTHLICSGQIFKVEDGVKVGGFNNKLFIDSVDFDFSLKLRNNGIRLYIINNLHMFHTIGEKITVGSKNEKVLMVHNSFRYYYIFRNNIYIIFKYIWKNPIFCIKKQVSTSFLFYKIVFSYPNKKRNVGMAMKGIYHGLISRYGRLR